MTDKHQQAHDSVRRYGGIRPAARALGIPESTLRQRLQKDNQAKPQFEYSEDGNTGTINSISDRIRTLEDALAYGEVDEDIWTVERYTINSWEVDMKLSTTDGKRRTEKPIKRHLWQVKVWLKRKVAKHIEEGLQNLFAKAHKWKLPKVHRRDPRQDEHMLELAMYDVHFGKLAWAPETGEGYDLKRAHEVYLRAFDDLLSKVKGFNIGLILLPVGQDFFHINNRANTTLRGTPQHVDSRLPKIFEVGCEAVLNGIERCRQIAPVEVLYVPGNHDWETSYYLVKFLEGVYRGKPGVTIDKSPAGRKYKHYGVSLIGLTHGHQEKHHSLPHLMATEAPEAYTKSKDRVWHLGHWHKKKEQNYYPLDEYNGIRVQVIPSLCGTDAWHFEQGYVKNIKAAEAFLWSHDNGYVGQFSARVA